MVPAPTPPQRTGLVLAFAAVYLIWGSTYLAIRVAIETMPPFLMAGTRFLIAGAPLVLWARLRGAPPPTASNWRAAAVVGTLMLFGGNGLVTWAEQTVSSGLAAILIATVPLWMAALDRFAFGGPRLSRLTLVGLTLGFAGVLILVGPTGGDVRAVPFVGGLACVVASFFWAMGSLHSRRADLPRSQTLGIGMEMIAGGAVMIGVGSLTGEWSRVDPGAFSVRSVVALVYLVTFGSIVALSAYVWLLRNTSAAAVSTYAFVNPAVAVVLGWLVLAEVLDLRAAIASGLIVAAVIVIHRARTVPRGRALIRAWKPNGHRPPVSSYRSSTESSAGSGVR